MPAYLQIDKIKGNVTEKEHKDWIRIESYSFGGMNPSAGDPSKKGKLRGGGVQFQEVNFVKELDTATPLISKTMAIGAPVAKVIFHVCEETSKTEPTYTMELKDCIITSQSISQGGEMGTESLSFAFSEFEVTATDMDEKGGKGATQKYRYSLIEKTTA
jgi:type VI secretion system secreted protein Hcp